MHQEIQVNKPYTFTWRFYANAIQSVPSAATVTITNKIGTTKQTGAGTIATDGTVTYIFLAANNTSDDINFKVVVSYIVSGTTTEIAELFDVVLCPIINLTTDSDLYIYLPEIRRKIFEHTGETDSNGTLSTLQDDGLKSDDRDFTGGKVEIFVSDTLVHDANITAYAKSTGIISFSPAYASTISLGLKYIVRESFTSLIDLAFDRFVRPDLRQRKQTLSGYIDSQIVKDLVTFKALALYCFQGIEVDNDKWSLRYKQFSEMYSTALEKFVHPYDDNEDGKIDDQEESNKTAFYSREIRR